jgi:thiol-disulfide isomerase/thioredoxin
MVKRRVAWEFYVVSTVITLFILFMGVYLGIFLSKGKIEELQKELTSLKIRQEDLMFELTLLTLNKNISCSMLAQALEKVMDEAGKLGDRVSLYETTEKIKDENFYNLKKDYTLTLIRYWLYVEEIKKNCDKNNLVSVLYFYSNQNCFDCLSQGTVLTYLKQKYPQNLMVFALDYDLDLSVISALKRVYGIQKVPSLVINGEKYEGLASLEKLNEILCTKYKLC